MTTKIEWTDETANWIVGCTKTRAKGAKESGCDQCYAATAANSARLQQFDQYKTVVDGNGNWNGNIEFVPKVLEGLLKGKRKRRVFAPSMSDPFHPNVKDEWLDQFMATVGLTPHIQYQVLTKRAKEMYEYFSATVRSRYILEAAKKINSNADMLVGIYPYKNLHLGVSVENQAAADERVPWLLKTPAAVRFLSVEPLLEQVYLDFLHDKAWQTNSEWHPGLPMGTRLGLKGISQIIVGGESGPNARSFNLDWARSLRHQCQESGTKFFLKQLGSNVWDGDCQLKLRDRKGGAMEEWPEDLRIRELV